MDYSRSGRTQRQRSDAMRARLLRAAVEILGERGWAMTTTTAVCERAGVSRGAQLHHFPTRVSLLDAVADYLMVVSVENLRGRFELCPYDDLPSVLGLLADFYATIHARAAVEARLAAESVEELGDKFTAASALVANEAMVLSLDRLGLNPADPEHRSFVGILIDHARGSSLGGRMLNPAGSGALTRALFDRLYVTLKPNDQQPAAASRSSTSQLS